MQITNEQLQELNQAIKSEKRDLDSARRAYKRKMRQLEKRAQKEGKNLFGEARSSGATPLFEVPADTSYQRIREALKPESDAILYHDMRLQRLQKVIRNVIVVEHPNLF